MMVVTLGDSNGVSRSAQIPGITADVIPSRNLYPFPAEFALVHVANEVLTFGLL